MARQPALRKPTDANYDDLLIDFSNSAPAQTEQTEAQEEPGFWEKAWNSAGAIAEGLTMLPGGIWDTVVDTWNGDDIDVTDREAIEARRQRENEKQAYLKKWDGKAWDGVAGAMVSMPYSLGTMGAALGAGVAGMAAGPVAAGAAGMAASGAMAYRATKHDFLQRLLDTSEQALGRELTQDEWNNIANEFEAEATKYGAWEAIPEAVGNMLFIKLLGPLGKKFMQEGIAKTAGRFVGAHAEEQVTETATQYGQGAIDAEMGWRDKAPTLWEAAKEQAPMTFWQTTLMGGGKKAADYVYNRIKGRSEEVADNAEPETQNATADKEAADFGPLDTFFDNAYGPTSEADAAWYEAQARQQANLRPVPQYDQGNPEAAYIRAQAAHETANRFTAGQLGSRLEAKGNTRKEIYDFARGLLDLGYTDAQVEQLGEWWANDIYNTPGNPLEGFRLAGLDDDNIRGFLDQLLPANSAQASGGVQAAVNTIQAQAEPQTTSQATPQPATQAQHNSDNPLAGYDPQIVEHYRSQGFSDEDIAEFLPNTSQGQQTAAQINSGQAVDLLAPEREQPAGIAGSVVQQSANDLDALAEQWAAQPEVQGNQASISANNVQPAGGVAGAVIQQDPVPQLPAQPIAQPAPMPTQSQITNTQQAPKADTQAAANALGIPAPEALPQEAQPVQEQQAAQPVVEPSQTTQQNPQDFLNSHIIVGSAPILSGGKQAQNAANQNAQNVRQGIMQGLEATTLNAQEQPGEPATLPESEEASGLDAMRDDLAARQAEANGTPVKSQTRQLPRKTHGKVRAGNGSDIEVYTENGLVHIGDFETQSPEEALASAKEFVDSNISIHAKEFVKPIVDAANYLLNEGKEESQAETKTEAAAPAKPLEHMTRTELMDLLTPEEKKEHKKATKQKLVDVIKSRQQGEENTGVEHAPEPASQEQPEQEEKIESLEDKYRAMLPLVAEIEPGLIHKTDDMSVVQAAQKWIEENVSSPVGTVIGEVEVDARGIKDSLSHGFSGPKIDAIPGIVPTLEKGVYLGELRDKDGKPIDNYYFTGRIRINSEDRAIFIRTRHAAGNKNRFYVHEVYTEEDINKAANARGVTDQDRPFQGAADFYKNLIAKYLEVKAEAKPASQSKDSNVASEKQEETTNGSLDREPAAKSVVESASQEHDGVQPGGQLHDLERGSGEIAGKAGERRERGGDSGEQIQRSGREREERDNSGENLPDGGRTADAGGNAAGREQRRDRGDRGRHGENEGLGDGSENSGRQTSAESESARERTKGKDKPEADRQRGDTEKREHGRADETSAGQVNENNARNHRIGENDVLVPGGPMARARANIAAIRLAKQLEEEGREATAEEKKILTQFTGWGSLAQLVFNQDYETYLEWEARGARWQNWVTEEQQAKYEKWKRDFGNALHPDLGGLLTQEEWDAAKRSTLNAHYTDRRVINAMWKMAQRLGFRGGKVLEPSAGSGMFFGLMPENIMQASQLTGVELDSMTGLILKHLYPDADIQITGFQDAKRCGDNTQDLVISNVPFGDYQVFDKKHPQYSKQSIHNYFFSRSLDVVKPGGLCILITSHHTLDAADVRLREGWGQKADLIGAVRLPGTSFEKNAGTSVTTDIVIFRKKSNSAFNDGQSFRSLAEIETPEGTASINEYFVAHPEMALGEHSLDGSMYSGKNEYTLKPSKNETLEAGLNRTVAALPENVFGTEKITSQESNQRNAIGVAETGMREGALIEIDGELGIVTDGLVEKPGWANKEKLRGEAQSYLRIKEIVKNLLQAMNTDSDNKRVDSLRKNLNEAYDEHFKKYGGINREGASFLEDDIEFYIVAAIENVVNGHDIRIIKSGKNKGKQKAFKVRHISKGDIFRKRTVFPFHEPETAQNMDDAIKISRIYRNGIDLPYVAKLLGMSTEQAKEALLRSNDVFENPATGLLEPRDIYLSGNVRKKLKEAEAAVEDNPAYEKNVQALHENQPPRVHISQINARLGSTWMPQEVYTDFLQHLGASNANVQSGREGGSEGTTRFTVDCWGFSAEANNTWGTNEASIGKLVQDCLNMKRTVISYKDADGKSVKDEEATAAAQEKQDALQEEFARWLPESSFADLAEEEYNDKVNHSVLRKFEVPDIKFYPGASHEIELRPNQKLGVARALQESCLLAHGVGSGKTMLQITTAMEARRLGTARKPVIVVQGATLSQFAASFKKLYPGANILAPNEKQRDSKNRKRLLAQIATGDWDAVILPHGFFNGLDVRPETEERFINEQIAEFMTNLNGLGKSDKTRKQIEKQIEKLKVRISKLANNKRDEIYWDDLGVDMLIIDEAHAYKRGYFATKMDNFKGLDKGSPQRSWQLLMKSKMIRDKTGGKNIILATGTPISNTLTEMWTMLRYIRPDLLREYHAEQFDDFASLFTTTTRQLEETQSGEWKVVERFNKYVNGAELLRLWRTAADVVLTEDLDFIKNMPKLKGGEIQSVVCPLTNGLDQFIQKLQEMRRAWDKSGSAKRDHPSLPLEIMSMARKASLDLRLVDKDAADDPQSKVNIAVQNVYDRYQRDQRILGTQLVFADLFQNKETGFNLFRDMRDKLVARGIPKEEIAIIHEHDSDAAREKLFDAVNSGEIRILFGTTEKLGVGVNVQEHLGALHHLDASLRPMDFEQRNGRIRRPGNTNSEIEILAYGTTKTLDATMFQLLQAKQKFINQMLRGDIADRSFENPFDESQQSFSDLEAAYSGNPLVKEKNQLSAEIVRLNTLKNAHYSQIAQKKADLNYTRSYLGKLEEKLPERRDTTKFIKQNFPGGDFSNRKELAKAIGDWLAAQEDNIAKETAKIKDVNEWNSKNHSDYVRHGSFDLGHGVKADVALKPDMTFDQEEKKYVWKTTAEYSLSGPYGMRYGAEFSGANGLLTRISNFLKQMEASQANQEAAIKAAKDKIKALEKAVKEPFKQASEMDAVNKRMAEIEAELKKESEAQASIRPGEYLASHNGNARGVTEAQARQVADRLNARAKNAAGVEVAQTFWDLPLNLQNKFSANVNTLEGVFDPNTGKVWLVADNLESTARAAEVWAHEQIVHNGLRGMLTESERRNVLNQLWLSMDGMGNQLIKRIAEAYGLNPRGNLADRLLVMEETLANLAERRQAGLLTPQQESMWRKIVRAIARVWNAVIERVTGRHASMGMEQVDNLLAALGGYVMDGVPANGQLAGEAAASLSENGGDTNSYGVPMERVTKISGNITKSELQNALRKLAGIDLENYIENITAQVNRNQSEKMRSAVAIKKSIDNGFTYKEHYALAAQIANAWKWAADTNVAGSKNNVGDVKVGRFVSPLMVNGQDVFAWITTKATQDGLRIYSIELLNEKTLRGVLGNDTETSSPHPARSIEDIIARLKGPVNQTNVPLAALNLRQILNMGSKQAVNAVQAPEIRHFFRESDLTLMQSILQLPHWLAKQQPKFAQIYERQIRRKDERAEAVTKSLREVPSLFGKGQLGKTDMESLKRLIWEIEGEQFDFEKATKKFLPDGEFANGRKKLKVNQQFYDEYVKAIDGLQATDAAKKAMLEIRKSLDNDLCLAYNRMASMGEMTDDAITQFRDRINHISNYFPHHRYGRYFIQAKKDGEVVFRRHFDALNKAMAKRKAREIAQEQMQNYPDAEWIDGENAKLPDEILGAPIDAEAMEQIIKSATSKIGDKEQAEKINTLLCQGVADVLKTRGWSEHAIGRKGVPGFEMDDVVKVLYDYKSGLHGWLTKMEAAKDFSRALADIDARQNPKLWKYASQYVKDMLRNSDGIDRMTGNIKAVAFAWYLGANLKTAVVNATQNIIVGVPRLQMEVSGGAHLWLKGAMDAIVNRVAGNKGSNLTADEAKLIQELYEQDVITDAFMTEVRGHMGGVSGAGLFNKFTRILGWPMSEVERFNRTSLALAAFRAVMQGKLKQSAKDKYGITGKPSYEQAKQFAAEVVRDAHFVYGKTNMPEFMRSNTTGRAVGSAYTFRTFSHNMLNMWLWALKTQGKEGAAFTAKSIGSTMVLGGVTAMPLYATLMALFQAVTGDDDDWTEEIRQALPDNNLLRDVVCYGAPAFSGFNIGGSLKMETPMTKGMRNGSNPKDVLTESIGDIIGIPYDLAVVKPTNIAKALDAGNHWRAIEELVPTFVKNGMQAWRLYDEGQTTMKGVPINTPGKPGARKLTEAEAIGKLLGFQPVSSTKSFEAYQAQKRHDEVRSDKIDEIVLKVLRAQDTGEMKYQREGIKEMERWNERMKKEGKQGMMFNFKDVMRRVKRRRSGNRPSAKQVQKGESQMAVWGV